MLSVFNLVNLVNPVKKFWNWFRVAAGTMIKAAGIMIKAKIFFMFNLENFVNPV
jgi:hypothetical protein